MVQGWTRFPARSQRTRCQVRLPMKALATVPAAGDTGNSAEVPADPVFLLGLPLSVATVVAAMLGQHPQLYSLPETHLFVAETVRDWWDICAASSFNMSHGLLRAV